MNFPGIIYNGITNVDNKKDLKDYFIREFKKAKRDHYYTPEIFFTPLFHLVEAFKKEIDEKFEGNKKWYENVISKAGKNELDFYDYYHTHCLDKKGISYEDFKSQQNQREFEEREKEFREFSIEFVSTKNKTYKLSEIRQIEEALKQAENSLHHKGLTEEVNTINTASEKQKMHITVTDRVLRELDIIELIFTAQYSKYDETEQFPYILDHTGRCGKDGRYIASLDVFSDVELFNLQLYKQHFTERFEGSINHKLLKHQLADIRQKAEHVKNYYNSHLTAISEIVREYLERRKELANKKEFKEGIELFETHSAIVTISHYHLMELYLGTNRSSKQFTTDNYTYSYISDNNTLATFCQKLIDFIDSIGIDEQKSETQSWQTDQQKNTTFSHFEREFKKANIPFTDIIENKLPLKNELFEQYVKAETKPCFDLYLAEYYSTEDLNKGFEEVHRQIPVSNSKEIVAANFVATTPFEKQINKLHQQFVDKVVKGDLHLKYYCPDIEKTEIVHALRRIDNERQILQKSVLDEKTDKYKEAEIRANNVIELAATLENLGCEVLERLKGDNSNILLTINKADKLKSELWDTLKSNFDGVISKAILFQKVTSRKFDPYSIKYNSNNSIEFRDNKIYFPFDCFEVFKTLGLLHEKLVDKYICSADVQGFPTQIFKETELKHHPLLAAWVYNIIETWVIDAEEAIHENKKKRLFDSFLSLCEKLANEAQSPVVDGTNTPFSGTTKKEIAAPVIALFCSIINDANVETKEEIESIETFCKRVCNQFELRYTDNVRQGFNNNSTKRNIEKIRAEILPTIEDSVRNKITDYLNNKAQTKQNLYG